MLLLAERRGSWLPRSVQSDTNTDREAVERQLMGRALKALRERAHMTQQNAADAMSPAISIQAWQNYEGGKRRWTPRLIADTTHAVRSTPDELRQEAARLADASDSAEILDLDRARGFTVPLQGKARLGPSGMEVFDSGRPEGTVDLALFLGPDARFLRVASDAMHPYVSAGGWVSYNLNRPPKRGQGCVIEMKGGSFMVRRFESIIAGKLFVTELQPQERQVDFDLADVEGVYLVGLRSD